MHKLAKKKYEDIRVTQEGVSYDFDLDLWTIELAHYDNVYINFKGIKENSTCEFFNEVKQYASLILKQMKSYTVAKLIIALDRYVKYTNRSAQVVDNVRLSEFLNYMNNGLEYTLPNLSVIIKNFSALGFKYIDKDVVDAAENMSFARKNMYKNVLTADVNQGPFTSNELHLLLNKLEERFEEDQISFKQMVLSYIYFCLGIRSIQISPLKVCDFYSKRNSYGVLEHYLKVPRAKQRGVNVRELFKDRKLDPTLAEMIQHLIAEEKDKHLVFGNDIEFIDMPLFPNYKRTQFTDLKYHSTSQQIAALFRNIWDRVNVVSERTNEAINVNPYRVRRTLGTRAALEGKNPHYIAELLDHSTLNSVFHYVKFAREMATEIQDAIIDDINPVISAFRGEIISEAPIAGTKSRIRNNSLKIDAGLCVSKSGCGVYSSSGQPLTILAHIPFSCYTCVNFSAWSNIEAHIENLNIILQLRDKVMKGFGENLNKEYYNMASSLDVTISAINEVIRIIDSGELITG